MDASAGATDSGTNGAPSAGKTGPQAPLRGRPPGPPNGLWGAGASRLRHAPHLFLTELAGAYGPICYFRALHQHIYLITEPELIRQILVEHSLDTVKSRILQRAKQLIGNGLLTSEGQEHLRNRRIVQPGFHRERLVGYATQMTAAAAATGQRWQQLHQKGESLALDREMMRLTLAVVGQTLFSADVEGAAADVGEAMEQILGMMPLLMLPGSQLFPYLPLPVMRRYKRAGGLLDATIYRLITQRRAELEAGQPVPDDLLTMLLQARDADEPARMFTDQQIRDEAMTLFLAGHETTATALTWAWYLLAQHPEAEACLHAELDAALGGRLPTLEDLAKLPFAHQVMAETMRLYPPAWAMGRMVVKPFVLGGYHLPRKSILLLPQWCLHRDARFWPEPLRFLPQRWANQEFQRRDFTYFPFGGGPRLCIGERFAWMEGVLLLATLAQQWRLRLTPGQAIQPKALITLRPSPGPVMRLEPRA